jgi:hypothetical protein
MNSYVRQATFLIVIILSLFIQYSSAQSRSTRVIRSGPWVNGTLTFYNLNGNRPHCSFLSGNQYAPKTNLPYVAINEFDLNGNKACGSCVKIKYKGKTIKAEVVDLCPFNGNPKCVQNHLDIQDSAFTQLAPASVGYITSGLKWKYTPCP